MDDPRVALAEQMEAILTAGETKQLSFRDMTAQLAVIYDAYQRQRLPAWRYWRWRGWRRWQYTQWSARFWIGWAWHIVKGILVG